MNKLTILALFAFNLLLVGCATTTEKKFKQEISSIVEYSARYGEPCNVTCGKLKAVVERYKK